MKRRESELYTEGVSDGREWGSDYASGDELEYVVEKMEVGRAQFANDSMCDFMSAKHGEQMIQVRTSDEGDERFYWQGFIEGASQVLMGEAS